LLAFLLSLVHNHPKKTIFGIALIITLPSLWVGLSADDYVIRSVVLQQSSLAKEVGSPLDTFAFIPSPEHIRRGMERGVYPWWIDPNAVLAFWRPLSAATHWLDFHLFPHQIWLMHLHSLLWYGALGVLAFAVYRNFFSTSAFAFLAGFLYICDEAHGMSVGWLAARNAITAPVFAFAMFLAHIRWREKGNPVHLILAVLLLTFSLLSGESGVAIAGYLFAYACFLDPKGKFRGVFSLFPYATVVVFWRLAYVRMGYAALGTGLYIDPGKNPVQFLLAVMQRLPVLLLGQLLGPNSGAVTLLPDNLAIFYVAFSVVVIVVIFLILAPQLKRDCVSQFFALGMVLSTIPSCATLPNDRLLFFAGMGGMGLVARFLELFVSQPLPGYLQPSRIASLTNRVLARLWILVHALLAPMLMPIACLIPLLFGVPIFREAETLPDTTDQKPVIITNIPVDLMLGYLPMILEAEAKPQPKYFRLLTATFSKVKISRPDASSLVVQVSGGLFQTPWARSFRDITSPFVKGDRVEIPEMLIEVINTTPDGRPETIRFTFPKDLDKMDAVWVSWSPDGFQTFAVPEMGKSVTINRMPTLWWLHLLFNS